MTRLARCFSESRHFLIHFWNKSMTYFYRLIVLYSITESHMQPFLSQHFHNSFAQKLDKRVGIFLLFANCFVISAIFFSLHSFSTSSVMWMGST